MNKEQSKYFKSFLLLGIPSIILYMFAQTGADSLSTLLQVYFFCYFCLSVIGYFVMAFAVKEIRKVFNGTSKMNKEAKEEIRAACIKAQNIPVLTYTRLFFAIWIFALVYFLYVYQFFAISLVLAITFVIGQYAESRVRNAVVLSKNV